MVRVRVSVAIRLKFHLRVISQLPFQTWRRSNHTTTCEQTYAQTCNHTCPQTCAQIESHNHLRAQTCAQTCKHTDIRAHTWAPKNTRTKERKTRRLLQF